MAALVAADPGESFQDYGEAGTESREKALPPAALYS